MSAPWVYFMHPDRGTVHCPERRGGTWSEGWAQCGTCVLYWPKIVPSDAKPDRLCRRCFPNGEPRREESG